MCTGLARKEDFPYITYYCPHCHALNKTKQSEERVSGFDTPNLGALTAGLSCDTISAVTSGLSGDTISAVRESDPGDIISNPNGSPSESVLASSSTALTGPEVEEKSEEAAEADVVD